MRDEFTPSMIAVLFRTDLIEAPAGPRRKLRFGDGTPRPMGKPVGRGR